MKWAEKAIAQAKAAFVPEKILLTEAQARERLIDIMIKHGFSTGHADGWEDLLKELDDEIEGLRGAYRMMRMARDELMENTILAHKAAEWSANGGDIP